MNPVRRFFAAAALTVFFALLLISCAPKGTVKLPVIKDTALWMYRGEPTTDFGAAEPLFVEGAHYAALLGFDVSAARGKKVNQARLWLHQEGEARLVKLALSTISADWIEGSGTGVGADPMGSCAAYGRIDQQTREPVRWAGPGSDVTDVIMTHGNTLIAEQEVRQESGGWQSAEVPPEIAEAIINGESFGLVLHDGKGQLHDENGSFIKKRFNSREAGSFAPYLEVVVEDAPAGVPNPPEDVEIAAAHEIAGLSTGGARVLIKPGGKGDARGSYYEVLTSYDELNSRNIRSAEPVPRCLLPRISQNVQDTVPLSGLTEAVVHAAVRTVNRYGRRSEWVFARGIASPALQSPVLAREKRPSLGGRIRVWACGADEKVNPVNSRLLEENPAIYTLEGDGNYDYMYENHLWDASRSTVSLDVPRGGTAAFQLLVEPAKKSLSGISVQAGWINKPGGARSRFPVKIHKIWYLKSPKTGVWYPEVAVPLDRVFSVPDEENRIAGQRNQAILAEFYVPRASRPGNYSGRVVISARGLLARNISVQINVHEAMLPEKLPFISEMNVYSPVGSQYGLDNSSDEYFELEEKYYRMAHEHLCAINQLPYSQTGTIKDVGAPELEGEGESMRVSDWSRWDRRFGRYLDSSAFAGTDRKVPIAVMYLPFFENWPAGLNKYYRFTPTDTSYVGMVNEHALSAPPVEKAFAPAFEQEWVGVLKQFAGHFREKGWTGTEFQVYLNNKYYWKRKDRNFSGSGISWWLLDEPYHWDDFKAIGWFGRLFMKAVGDVRDIDMRYRIDVSRPHLQFGLWDGLRSVSYVSSYFYVKNAYLRWRKDKFGEKIRGYGSFNNLEVTNLTATAWPLKVYLNGGDGLLPWQTIASDENYESFQNTAIFYPGVRFGIQGPVASLRLKAVRQGTEDVTLLHMLAEREGWTLEQAAVAVASRVDLGEETISEFFDDAGRVSFGRFKPEQLAALRRDFLRSLNR